MNWWSEAAILWLPVASHPAPADFADRPRPGTADFHYYALDAFEAIARARSEQFDREPWVYILSDQQVLSPGEVDALMDEWQEQLRVIAAAELVTAGPST